mgnify:CR=1 FL=1
MTKLELKEWITELACSLDRGDLKIDELMNEVEEIVDKNVTEQLTLTDVSQQRELLLAYHKHLDSFNDHTIYNASESMIDDYLANNCG